MPSCLRHRDRHRRPRAVCRKKGTQKAEKDHENSAFRASGLARGLEPRSSCEQSSVMTGTGMVFQNQAPAQLGPRAQNVADLYLPSPQLGRRGSEDRWQVTRQVAGGGDHRRHLGRGMARKRGENGHSSRADGDSMGPSALDGKNGVACGSARKPRPRPVAALRASPLATPAIRAC